MAEKRRKAGIEPSQGDLSRPRSGDDKPPTAFADVPDDARYVIGDQMDLETLARYMQTTRVLSRYGTTMPFRRTDPYSAVILKTDDRLPLFLRPTRYEKEIGATTRPVDTLHVHVDFFASPTDRPVVSPLQFDNSGDSRVTLSTIRRLFLHCVRPHSIHDTTPKFATQVAPWLFSPAMIETLEELVIDDAYIRTLVHQLRNARGDTDPKTTVVFPKLLRLHVRWTGNIMDPSVHTALGHIRAPALLYFTNTLAWSRKQYDSLTLPTAVVLNRIIDENFPHVANRYTDTPTPIYNGGLAPEDLLAAHPRVTAITVVAITIVASLGFPIAQFLAPDTPAAACLRKSYAEIPWDGFGITGHRYYVASSPRPRDVEASKLIRARFETHPMHVVEYAAACGEGLMDTKSHDIALEYLNAMIIGNSARQFHINQYTRAQQQALKFLVRYFPWLRSLSTRYCTVAFADPMAEPLGAPESERLAAIAEWAFYAGPVFVYNLLKPYAVLNQRLHNPDPYVAALDTATELHLDVFDPVLQGNYTMLPPYRDYAEVHRARYGDGSYRRWSRAIRTAFFVAAFTSPRCAFLTAADYQLRTDLDMDYGCVSATLLLDALIADQVPEMLRLDLRLARRAWRRLFTPRLGPLSTFILCQILHRSGTRPDLAGLSMPYANYFGREFYPCDPTILAMTDEKLDRMEAQWFAYPKFRELAAPSVGVIVDALDAFEATVTPILATAAPATRANLALVQRTREQFSALRGAEVR